MKYLSLFNSKGCIYLNVSYVLYTIVVVLMQMDRAVDRLKQLGLTEYQARVLYALLKRKSCKISDIASMSGVPNTRIYDVVAQLIDRKFVIQISNRPKTFRVRNVDQVLDSLLDEKTQEIQRIKEDIQMMKEFFRFDDSVEETKLLNVDKVKDLPSLLSEEFSKAKKEIIGFGHTELENKELQGTLKDLNNKIDVRLITHPDVKVNLDFVKTKHHNMCAYVIDDSKLIVGFGDGSKAYNLGIFHNQDSLKNMVKTHFNNLWEQP